MSRTSRHRPVWDILGLGLALLGPGLVAWLGQSIATEPETLAPRLLSLAVFTAVLLSVVSIALFAQKLGPKDVGFGNMGWSSLGLAALLAAFFIFVFGPLAYLALSFTDLGGFEAGLANLHDLPIWYLVMTILLVAGGEEWLYRAYAIERLEKLTGRAWVAGSISLFLFFLVHLPFWGTGPALTTLVSGGILTALYIWRRDILMLILAHVATDLIGILP